jgi:ferredoxin
MKTLYFTGTGNSLYAAKRIGGELLSIPQLLADKKFDIQDDAVGLVYPCYGWGLPRIVEEYLDKARLKADYFFGVMTYGNIGGGGLRHLEKAGCRAGIKFSYTNEILMVDNYLPMFDIKDQLEKETSKNIEGQLSAVCADIAARKNRVLNKGPVKNLFADFLLGKPRKVMAGTWLDRADRKFYTDAKCNACGVCAKVCPRGNIALNPKPEFRHRCEGCYACINNCPQAALHLTNEKNGLRFRNANIGLPEIVAANDMTARG